MKVPFQVNPNMLNRVEVWTVGRVFVNNNAMSLKDKSDNGLPNFFPCPPFALPQFPFPHGPQGVDIIFPDISCRSMLSISHNEVLGNSGELQPGGKMFDTPLHKGLHLARIL